MDMLQGNLSPAEPGGDSSDGNTDENEQLQKPLEESPCPSGPPIDHYQPSGRKLTKKELLDRLSYASQKAWSSVRKRSLVPLPLPAATERRMRQWFELVDGDGSGHLSASEVEFALRATGINANANTVAEVIKLFDTNHDGEIAWLEFISFLSYEVRETGLQHRLCATLVGRRDGDRAAKHPVPSGHQNACSSQSKQQKFNGRRPFQRRENSHPHQPPPTPSLHNNCTLHLHHPAPSPSCITIIPHHHPSSRRGHPAPTALRRQCHFFPARAKGQKGDANKSSCMPLSSAKSPLGEDYVLPSGMALPIGSMIDALRRRKILEDVQKGGMQRGFWAAEGQEFLRYLLETEKYDFDDESRETIRRILEYKPAAVKEGEFALSPKAAEEHKRRIERLKQALVRNAGGGGGGGSGSSQRRASSTTRSRIHSAIGGPGSTAASIGPSGGRRSFDVTALQGGTRDAGGSSRTGSSRASRILRAVDLQRRGTVDGASTSSLAAAEAAAEGPAAAAADVMTEEDSESGGSFSWIAVAEENLAARVRFCSPALARGLILADLDRSGEGTPTSASASASASPRYDLHPSSSGCSSNRVNPNSAPPSTTTSRTVLPDGGVGVGVGIYLGRVSGDGAASTATTAAAAAGGGVWSAAASAAASGSTRRDVGERASGSNDTYDISGWAAMSTRRPVLGPARGLSPFLQRGTGGGQQGRGAGGSCGLNVRMQVEEKSSDRGLLVACAGNDAADGLGRDGEGSVDDGNGEENHHHTGCHDHDDDEE
ncbi:hypothetical protein Vafri_5763, partial [Volvox africanus]